MENILSVALDLWPGTLKETAVGYSALHPLVADHKGSEDRRKGVYLRLLRASIIKEMSNISIKLHLITLSLQQWNTQ